MDQPAERSADESGRRLTQEAEHLLDAAAARGVTLRVMGGIAIRIRCPGQIDLLDRLGRRYEDVDLVTYGRHAKALREVLSELGYTEDTHVYVNSAGTRMVAFRPSPPVHLDVFLDDLEFSHTIPMKGRLESAEVTLALSDLMLGKLQIAQINRKDLVDLVALTVEHEVGTGGTGIDADRIAELTAEDWGLWRTATSNLDRLRAFYESSPEISGDERTAGLTRVDAVSRAIEGAPKGLRWRMRAKVGDRVKWYRDVEDLREGEGVPKSGGDEGGRDAAP